MGYSLTSPIPKGIPPKHRVSLSNDASLNFKKNIHIMPLMTGADSRHACLTTERLLEELTAGLYPHMVNLNTYGTIDAIRAAQNSTGVASIINETDKRKPEKDGCTRWEIRYKAKRCNYTCETSIDPCELKETEENPWLYAYPVMEEPICAAFTLTHREYECVCEGREDILLEKLREAYESLKFQENQRYLKQLISMVGNYFLPPGADPASVVNSGTSPETLCIMTNSPNPKPNPMGIFPLIQQFRRMGVQGSPYVIGGAKWNAYAYASGIFAGNVDGFDANRGANLTAFIDYELDAQFADGEEHLIAFAPGAVFPLEYFMYRGQGAYASPTLVKDVFDLGAAFQMPGYNVDRSIAVQECGEDVQYIYKFFRHTDLACIPEDAFSPDCGQYHNYKLHYLVDCCDSDCPDC